MRNKADILIRGGLVYDGSLSEPYLSDIAIEGGRVAAVGKEAAGDAGVVIDAKGFAVSPGFIDTHAHSDFTLLADPRAEGKLCQGITTEVNGNCGMSAAPLYDRALERREDDLRELGIGERWNTVKEYFLLAEKRVPAVNFGMLVGHGNVRGSTLGYEDRQPSLEELSRMTRLVQDAIREGAIGLSTGLIYPPGIYSNTDELISLAKLLREDGLIYTSHMRSEANYLEEAVEEVLKIGRESGSRVHISHIKTAGQANWHKAGRVVSLIENGRKSGIMLTCDRYPYTASSTDLDALLPSWTFEGGNEEELRRLQSETEREKIRKVLLEQSSAGGYWEKVIVSSVASEKKWMEGLTIAAISRELGTDAIDTVFHILVGEKLRVGAIFLSMTEENLRAFLSLPFCMIGSDSSARCFDGPTKMGKPHPRTFGTFPRLFGKYVRQEGLLGLSEAVHKATMLAADTFGLEGRGRIGRGMYADLVIFDPEKIMDRATFEDPFQRPDGVHYVLVNGVPAVWEGEVTGKRAGMVLKGKKSAAN